MSAADEYADSVREAYVDFGLRSAAQDYAAVFGEEALANKLAEISPSNTQSGGAYNDVTSDNSMSHLSSTNVSEIRSEV
jgi:aspartokinase-like uncharacterized kinase